MVPTFDGDGDGIGDSLFGTIGPAVENVTEVEMAERTPFAMFLGVKSSRVANASAVSFRLAAPYAT